MATKVILTATEPNALTHNRSWFVADYETRKPVYQQDQTHDENASLKACETWLENRGYKRLSDNPVEFDDYLTYSSPVVRCRIDGYMAGLGGPLCNMQINRGMIAGIMGWQDSGEAVDVITKVIALLAKGKAVKLTCQAGYSVFQPLADGEDGLKIPQSAAIVYDPEGRIASRVVASV